MATTPKQSQAAKKATPAASAKKAEAKPVRKTASRKDMPSAKAAPAKPVATPAPAPVEAAPAAAPASIYDKAHYAIVRPSGAKQAPTRPARLPQGKQHFSDEVLEEFRKKFLAKRQEVLAQINATRSNALSQGDEENLEEDGTNIFTRDNELKRAAELHSRLRAIDDALRAVQNKTYGICSVCGCLIPRDRLRAYPFAIRCVACKDKHERDLAEAKRRTQG